MLASVETNHLFLNLWIETNLVDEPVNDLPAGGENNRVEHEDRHDGAEKLLRGIRQQILLLSLQARGAGHLYSAQFSHYPTSHTVPIVCVCSSVGK